MPRLIVGRRKDSFQKFQKTKETLLTVFVITRPIELTDELKKFRAERIATILEGTVPVVMDQEARVVVHIVPKSALDHPSDRDLSILIREGQSLRPIHAHGWDALRYNFDGLITTSSSDGTARSYVQIFHHGCIEAVNASLFRKHSRFITNRAVFISP